MSSVSTIVVVIVVYSMVSFCAVMLPPTNKSPPIPTPPMTCNAPELVDVADVELFTDIEFAVIALTPVMSPPVIVMSPPAPLTITPLPTVSSPVAASKTNPSSDTLGT